MHLLHFTQHYPTTIQCAIYGSFTAPLAHELVIARGRFLELISIVEGRLVRVIRQDCFAHIRGISSIRLSGQTKDIIVVSSDSGRLTFLSATTTGHFKREACETFGKWGMRRVVPGQFLASDPKGRAVMLSAVEKDKLVFVTNRTAEDKLSVNSPLEANKATVVTFSIASLDVGFDNPVFAALEVLYDDGERESKDVPDPEVGVDGDKEVVFYELDLGTNHVIRKSAVKVDASSNFIIAVPSGVLVCSNDMITYVRPSSKQPVEHCKVFIPRRNSDLSPVIVVSHAAFASANTFFALLQTERGDLFKVTVDAAKGTAVCKYFDTVPVANQLCITLSGLLFVAAEAGDHELYQFTGLAEKLEADDVDSSQGEALKRFDPRSKPKNLELFDTMRSSCPFVNMQIDDLAKEDVPQLYCTSGTGPRSSLRVLRQGLAVTEIATTKLQTAPRGVWTIREGEFDKWVIVSQDETTQVLSIKDEVEKITTSGLQLDVCTMACSLWGTSQIVQVTQRGFSIIDLVTGKSSQDPWRLPGHNKQISSASINSKQIALALIGGEIIYFETSGSGVPVEASRFDNGAEISCVEIGECLEGRPSRFLVLGSVDKQVKILSLDNNNLLVPLSTQLLPERPVSISLTLSSSINEPTRLEIGLSNGLLVRSILDNGGVIVDTRTHVLGSRPVRCHRIRFVHDQSSMTLLCTSRPWLARGSSLTPLSFMGVDFAAPFASEHAQDGLIAVSGKTLRVVMMDPDFEQRFNEQVRQLAYTPRRLVKHPNRKDVIICEGERGVQNIKQRRHVQVKHRESKKSKVGSGGGGNAMDVDDDETQDDGLPNEIERQVGYPRGPNDTWTGLIRVFDPTANKTLYVYELPPNELAVSAEICTFHDVAGEIFLAVGTVVGYKTHPGKEEKRIEKGMIRLFRIGVDRLELLDKTTEVPDIPAALCAFDGRLLAGVGTSLVLYDLGKKQLLKKCELKGLPSHVAFIKVQGSERIVIGDSRDSCFFVNYSRTGEGAFNVFADDVTSRMTSCGDMVDYNTVACGDRNGNVFVLRLPPGATGDDIKSKAAAQRPNLWDQSPVLSCAHKLDLQCHFYVGETIASINKCQLSVGHSESLVYSTIFGTIGTLCPFPSRDDLDFFSHLELHMRKYYVNLVGRDHLQFRSYYAPCKQVVDGDFCELFGKLELNLQQKIAKEMDKSPLEILKRIEEARALVLW